MEKFVKIGMLAIYVLSLLLLTTPAIFVYTSNISFTLFVVLNTAGIVLATLFIMCVAGVRLAIARLDAKMTEYSMRNNLMAKVLFVVVIVAQLFNLMFVNGV